MSQIDRDPTGSGAILQRATQPRGRIRFVVVCTLTIIFPVAVFLLGISPLVFFLTATGMALIAKFASPPITPITGYFIGLLWQYLPYWMLVWLGHMFG